MSENNKKKRPTRVRSNLKRCPYIKITKKEYVRDEKDGFIVREEIEENFNECYKSFCMAWDADRQLCMYLLLDLIEQAEHGEDEDEEDD